MSTVPGASPVAENATIGAAAPESAQARLARSRAAITGWLAADEAERAAPGGPGGLPAWLQQLRRHPLAAIAVDALSERWSRHPLAASIQVAEVAAEQAVAPLVRRHILQPQLFVTDTPAPEERRVPLVMVGEVALIAEGRR